MTKNFTIKLLLFAALLLLVNFTLDQAFKAFSVHNTVNRMMDEQFAEFDDTLKYLAMGNSHNCISTYILPQSFNYGSPSENYVQSYYKLKHILEKSGRKPQYLLLEADISCFGPKISARYEYNSYWIRYIDYFELARIKQSRDMLYKWMEGKFFSYVGNYKDIQLSIVYRIKMPDFEMYRGFHPHRDFKNFAHEANMQKVAWDKANLILSREEYFDPVMRAYFEMIFRICQEHGVGVILVKFPEAKEFYEEEARIVPVAKLYAEVLEIASKYPVYRGIMDYHDLYFDHPEYFFDPDHLNVKGSDLFTAKLAGDLKVMLSGLPAEQVPGKTGQP
jgi:hypothetical protein